MSSRRSPRSWRLCEPFPFTSFPFFVWGICHKPFVWPLRCASPSSPSGGGRFCTRTTGFVWWKTCRRRAVCSCIRQRARIRCPSPLSAGSAKARARNSYRIFARGACLAVVRESRKCLTAWMSHRLPSRSWLVSWSIADCSLRAVEAYPMWSDCCGEHSYA